MKNFRMLTSFIFKLEFGDDADDYFESVSNLVAAVRDFADKHPEFSLDRYQDTLDMHGFSMDPTMLKRANVSVMDSNLVLAFIMGAIESGSLKDFCDNGCMVKWLRRLKEIDDFESTDEPDLPKKTNLTVYNRFLCMLLTYTDFEANSVREYAILNDGTIRIRDTVKFVREETILNVDLYETARVYETHKENHRERYF